MDTPNSEDRNRGHLEEYLKESDSRENTLQWLNGFDHLRYSDFAGYYFEQIYDALNVFREIETTAEPTRIQLPSTNDCDIVKETDVKRNETKKNPILDVNDDLAFPPLGDSPKSTDDSSKKKKRVTPRRIATKAVDGNAKFIKSNYSVKENSNLNFRDEREELKQFKRSPFQRNAHPSQRPSCSREPDVSFEELKEPEKDKKLVIFDFLDDSRLSALKMMFVDFLQKSLFVRPTTFNDLLMINLQVLNRDPESVPNLDPTTLDSEIKRILSSYQKCFHFSYLIFEDIFINNGHLNQLSIPALLAIQNNELVLNYNADKKIRATIENLIQLKYYHLYNRSNKSCQQQFVSYDVNADSIENFSNANGFHNFRKQRDCFNSLLESYYKNTWRTQLTSDDKAMFTFINKIHAVMSSKSFFKFNNFPQLSKLFVEQMLKSCLDKSFLLMTGNPSINNTNKVLLLESRLTRQSTNNRNILDSFNQHFREEELFFRDFIFYGDSHIFNKHLLNSMRHSLRECQNSLIELLHSDESDQEYSDEFSKLFYFNVLLSKFIGFVDFYPYIVDKEASGKKIFIENQTELRWNCSENLDILDCLNQALKKPQLLIVHIPSIVEYLLFLDCVSFTNARIQNCIFILSAIYKFYLPKIFFKNASDSLFPLFRQILQLFLEKLFDNKSLNPDKIIENIDLLKRYFPQISSASYANESFDFDRLEHLINPQFLSEYSESFSKILQDVFDNRKEKRNKNITMLSLLSKKSLLSTSRKHFEETHYQSLLFEKFFSHSKSLKKCCDFVVESTYKNLVTILNDRLLSYQESLSQGKSFPFSHGDDIDQSIRDIHAKLKERFHQDFDMIYQQKSGNLQVFVKDNGFSEDAQLTILSISGRRVQNLCENWFEKHYNIQHLTAELRRNKSSTLIDQISAEQSQTVSSFIEIARGIVTNLRYDVESKQSFSIRPIVQAYLEARQLPDSLQIDNIFVDLLLTVLIKRPTEIDDDFIDELMIKFVEHNIYLNRLAPPYVLVMLEDQQSAESWAKYRTLLLAALTHRRQNFEHFQNSEIVPLLKITWKEETLINLSKILNSVVERALSLKLVRSQEFIILDWLSWIFQDAAEEVSY